LNRSGSSRISPPSSSSSQTDLLEWDPFSFGDLLRRSHGDETSSHPSSSGSGSSSGGSSSIGTTEQQTNQAIERGNQLLDVIYQLCDYIITNPEVLSSLRSLVCCLWCTTQSLSRIMNM
jgi:hypothetical protein